MGIETLDEQKEFCQVVYWSIMRREFDIPSFQ